MEERRIQNQSIQIAIEAALRHKMPIDTLRQLALELNNKGMKKEEIYQEFLNYLLLLEESDKQQDIHILGDVMDMMTGWYIGRELDLK